MVRRALGTIDFEIRVLSHEAALKRQLELEVLLLTQALAIADDTFGLFAPPPLRAPNAGDGNHGLALLPPAARPTVGRSHSLEIEISYCRQLALALAGTRTAAADGLKPAFLRELGERRLLLATLHH